MKEVSISTEIIKLDQFLKWAGIADSGSTAKGMVLSGIIRVNGEVVLERGRKLHKGDRIFVENMDEFIIL